MCVTVCVSVCVTVCLMFYDYFILCVLILSVCPCVVVCVSLFLFDYLCHCLLSVHESVSLIYVSLALGSALECYQDSVLALPCIRHQA